METNQTYWHTFCDSVLHPTTLSHYGLCPGYISPTIINFITTEFESYIQSEKLLVTDSLISGHVALFTRHDRTVYYSEVIDERIQNIIIDTYYDESIKQIICSISARLTLPNHEVMMLIVTQ